MQIFCHCVQSLAFLRREKKPPHRFRRPMLSSKRHKWITTYNIYATFGSPMMNDLLLMQITTPMMPLLSAARFSKARKKKPPHKSRRPMLSSKRQAFIGVLASQHETGVLCRSRLYIMPSRSVTRFSKARKKSLLIKVGAQCYHPRSHALTEQEYGKGNSAEMNKA